MSEKKCREAKHPNRGVIGECWQISEDGNHLLKMVVLMTMLTMMMREGSAGGGGGLLGNIDDDDDIYIMMKCLSVCNEK